MLIVKNVFMQTRQAAHCVLRHSHCLFAAITVTQSGVKISIFSFLSYRSHVREDTDIKRGHPPIRVLNLVSGLIH